jgi:hypothetical protein
VVLSLELAQRVAAEHTDAFVALLTLHTPRLVYFSAATPGQASADPDANLQRLDFWVRKFEERGYSLDIISTAKARNSMLAPADAKSFVRCWWLPKNLLVFAPAAAEPQQQTNQDNQESLQAEAEAWAASFPNADSEVSAWCIVYGEYV